jgi:glycosyltransferase involved in cell wall biosynthesis
MNLVIKEVHPRKLEGKIKVMWYSNAPRLPTGYAKITREVCKRLAKMPEFDVYIVGENETSNNIWEGCKVLACDIQKPVEALVVYLNEIKPDILIFLEDTFTLELQHIHEVNFNGIKTIGYFPEDGKNIPTDSEKILTKFDRIIAMANFCKDVIVGDGLKNVDVIYHGVDLKQYSIPLKEEKNKLKEKLGFSKNDFLIFNYARNSLRKANQTCIKGVSKFLVKHPDAKCLFHINDCERKDSNLIDYVTRILPREVKGTENILNKQLFFTPNKNFTDDDVAIMIKSSDLTITASHGEGFGLIMVESMACGIPVVSNEYSTPYELLDDESCGIGKRGLLAKSMTEVVSSFNVEHGYVDVEDFANKIEVLYGDAELRTQLGLNGRKFVETYCNWDKLILQWKHIIFNELGYEYRDNYIINGDFFGKIEKDKN